MNKTQKSAIFCLVTSLFCVVVMAYPFISIFILKSWPESLGRFWWFLAYCLFLGVSFIFLRRKQSPAEVDFDERDKLIKNRAVLASFISVWILLCALTVIPWFVVGPGGFIPVFLLPLISVGILLVIILVYSVAILVQYGWGGRKNE